jgi:hypothetical protein
MAIKHLSRPGWHADGGGLFLEVDPSGAKRWAMRLTINGKRRDFGLGPLHKVSLQQAREVAAEYRSKAYRGIDPTIEKKAALVVPESPTFEKAADEVHRQRMSYWSNGKHVAQYINTLLDYAFPIIGTKPIGTIAAPDLLNVLLPIWTSKPDHGYETQLRVFDPDRGTND